MTPWQGLEDCGPELTLSQKHGQEGRFGFLGHSQANADKMVRLPLGHFHHAWYPSCPDTSRNLLFRHVFQSSVFTLS